jgi:methyl coenzyme M reductase gamma subunit
MYYRAPGEDYKKIDKVLDKLHERLNNIEDVLAGEECQELPE